ncbi:lactate utilization protein [Pseudodesulfovibrio thermohalotolerans]|uniref:lactate utilization protein n=1 Tax=Pseudodesulfovibrio thermohalotolerans TaxID=2880651 RepID=UPI002442B43A|nr:lactate utilization protein [Pseudodesulfovibrio thermohalotolerans]WFS62882.1 lactate utilization protein [Pseudodesulfovibrio thermohalotolerans]
MHRNTITETMKALSGNGFKAYSVPDAAEARELILCELLPDIAPGVVSFGDSMTLTATGVLDALRTDPSLTFIDTFEPGVDRAEILQRRRRALLADLFLTGTNAVTKSGKLVNLDMVGNRVGGIVFGPEHVIITVSANKIVDDEAAAACRVREIAAPQNAARHHAKTPCAKTGRCADCKSPDRICNVWTITEKSWPKGRIKVVLIDQPLGL